MKFLLPLLGGLMLLSGCNATPVESPVSLASDTLQTVDCGTVTLQNGQDTPDSAAYFDSFWELVCAGHPACVRVTVPTTEGDPITTDLTFDGQAFTALTDTSADRFAAEPKQETTAWTTLFPLETYENGQIRRTWLLTNLDYETWFTQAYEQDGTPEEQTLFIQTIEQDDLYSLECGVFNDTTAREPDVTPRNLFTEFAYERKLPAHLRILSYTVEGDILRTDVTFDGMQYTSVYDTTEDAFGAQEVQTKTWQYLVRQPVGNGSYLWILTNTQTPNLNDDTEDSQFLFTEDADHPAGFAYAE